MTLPPLPIALGAWVPAPEHPMSSPGDPVRVWTGCYTAAQLHDYARAAVEAERARAVAIVREERAKIERGLDENDFDEAEGRTAKACAWLMVVVERRINGSAEDAVS